MRLFPWPGLLGLVLAGSLFAAENQNDAAANAARQEAEERHKRLSADIEALQAANVSLQKRLTAVIEELERVREEQTKSGVKYATQEDIRNFNDRLREMEKKRETDNEQILGAIRKLAALPVAPVATNARPDRTDKPEKTDRTETGEGTKPLVEKGYWHVVRDGDRLSTIVQQYRDQGVKVTMKQVLDANPKLDPKRLLIGKTRIWIPDPSQE